MSEEIPTQQIARLHPVVAAINTLMHRAQDMKFAARFSIPAAVRHRQDQMASLVKTLRSHTESLDRHDRPTATATVREINQTIFRLDRLRKSRVPTVLETGLFLALFSAFDAFTGDLLAALFDRRPDLFGKINRAISFSEILEAQSIEDIKRKVLLDEIEQIRRKSYVEQFDHLGGRFDVKLTEFPSWTQFVEAAQRRNLITHCDSVVSEQYISVCKSVGLKESNLPRLGERVTLGAEYFYNACEVMIEVGLKLAQTLWRKTIPAELSDADRHLNEVLYETLLAQTWPRAVMIGLFAVALPRCSGANYRQMFIINCAQALKFNGRAADAIKQLDSFDWSGAGDEFKLAEAVLRGEFDRAKQTMTRIGSKNDLMDERAYNEWPLFREFRDTEQFCAGYEEVFGYSYMSVVQQEADKAEASAVEQVNLENRESLNLNQSDSPNDSLPPVESVPQSAEETFPIPQTQNHQSNTDVDNEV